MLYISDKDVKKINYNWKEMFGIIESATKIMDSGDFCQPIKPYLDFKNPTDRIIAMPAYVGGDMSVAGIKWIASFPDNINHELPRANSITVLNSSKTGVPFAFFNTTELSIVRTTAVTGVILNKYLEKVNDKIKIGIIGFGPIGQMHYNMINSVFHDKISEIKIYDLRKPKVQLNKEVKTSIVTNWQEAYEDMDVVLTTTASKDRYIDIRPKAKALLLNVSLRDYQENIYEYVKHGIIVDNWEEVCRKNTDIERFNKQFNLKKEDTYTILDVMNDKVFNKIATDIYMFNPMGMSSYDVAIGKYFYDKVKEKNIGTILE